MIISLQEPFSSRWRNGYLVVNPENRKNVVLYNSEADRTTISYARYLMCVHLGYILSDEYEVDHKDDDKTNDRIDNLQVLTKAQNLIKQATKDFENQVVYGYSCANNCGTYFTLTERQIKMRLNQGVEMAFCSHSCAASYHVAKRKFLASRRC